MPDMVLVRDCLLGWGGRLANERFFVGQRENFSVTKKMLAISRQNPNDPPKYTPAFQKAAYKMGRR